MTFQHEALIYEGPESFLTGTLPFIRDGLESGEPVMVAVQRDKIGLLAERLGADADQVTFADMAELGANPNRIIPAWRSFVSARRGRPVRGIGEPVWAGRCPVEVVECQLHEALLNVAFAGDDGFRLMCPYDAAVLDPAVVHEALCSHPHVSQEHGVRASGDYRADRLLDPFESPLPPPGGHAEVLAFERDGLSEVRQAVAAAAERSGFGARRMQDVVLAVNELAANSMRHGGGRGVLRIWREDDMLVCEVRDRGRITDALAGRRKPDTEALEGRGLWIVNQLCDLVQLRSGREGTVVRALARAG
jgi:anti-sigma regulatory factor (Ser/Thr protein kinase)